MLRLNPVYYFKDLCMVSSKIPVLLISFNRPDLTKGAIENIRTLAPPVLFFAVDGPRESNPEDREKIQEVIEKLSEIDWDCEVRTLFSKENRGSGRWPYESISWALSQCKHLMILEDDIRVSKDFYHVGNRLVSKYEDADEVFAICASNISKKRDDSYFYTKYFAGWGWITWAKKWEKYSFDVSKENILSFYELLKKNNYNFAIAMYFYLNFYLISKNRLQAWDYQVYRLMLTHHKVCIKFNKNLSLNVGIGVEATHTKTLPKIEIDSLNIELIKSPSTIKIDKNCEKNWRKNRIKFIINSRLKRLTTK